MNKPTKKQLVDRVTYLETAVSSLVFRLGPTAGLTEADCVAEAQRVLDEAPSLEPEKLVEFEIVVTQDEAAE